MYIYHIINRSYYYIRNIFGRKEIFSLFNNAYFVYSDTVFDILWLNTTQIMGKETHCCQFMCYSFGLAARDFYMFHPTDRGTYHSLCNRVVLYFYDTISFFL